MAGERPNPVARRPSRKARRIEPAGWLAATCLILAGCFSYVPAETDSVAAGREIRVYLTRLATARLPAGIPTNGNYLAGSLVTRDRDSLMLRVPVMTRVEAATGRTLRQDVRVATGEILELRRRELSTTRTALVAAGAAGAAAAIVLMIIDTHGSKRPTPEEPPVLTRFPVFSIGIR